MRKTLLCALLVPVVCLATAACTAEKPAAPATSGQAAASLPESYFADAIPGTPVDVAALKTTAKEGDEVVVRGRIGGSAHPFVDGRASFMLADVGNIVACNDRPSDSCSKPWDFCCESREDIVKNTATVQVVGPDGKALKASVEGAHGIKPLSEIGRAHV